MIFHGLDFITLNMKIQLPLKVDESLKDSLNKEAAEQHRSLNNYVETLLITHAARGGFKDKKPYTKRKLKN